MPRAQRPELRQRLGAVGAVVVQPVGPQVLVVAVNRRPVLGDDAAQTVPPHQVAVGEMAQHLEHRPLARLLGSGEIVAREARHPADQLGGRPLQHGHGVAVAKQAQQRPGVVAGLVLGIGKPVAEDRHGNSFLLESAGIVLWRAG